MLTSVMELDTVFNPAFQKSLLEEIGICMTLAATMQARLSEPDFIRRKHDSSPVTEADHAVQNHLEKFLKEATPDWPFLGEENVQGWIDSNAPMPDIFWSCDPIDGTQDYASHGQEYAINLALIEKGVPVFGLIAGPARGTIAYMNAPDSVTFVENGQARVLLVPDQKDLQHATLIVGHGRRKDIIAFEDIIGQPVCGLIHCASALKFHALLLGQAHVYVRVRETSEWDIAAGEAMVRAMGGSAHEMDRTTPLGYGRRERGFKLDSVFIAMNGNG